MMELGIISYDISENAFQYVDSLGLKNMEICTNDGTDIEDMLAKADSVAALSQKYGIKICSVGCWGVPRINDDNSFNEVWLQKEKMQIDFCAKVGCPVYNTGCNYLEGESFYQNCTNAIQYFKVLLAYGKEKGVKIATYNCRWNSFVHSDPAWTVIHGALPELGIKYDPSHATYAGADVLSEMKKWGHRFYHVHIKGSLVIDGERFDDPPAGLDQTNWGAFLAVLYAKKYDGVLSIEPHSENWSGELGRRGVEFTIRYIKNLMV